MTHMGSSALVAGTGREVDWAIRALEEEGFTIGRLHMGGASLLTLVALGLPNIVVIDMRFESMAGMTLEQVHTALQRTTETAGIPVVYITHLGDEVPQWAQPVVQVEPTEDFMDRVSAEVYTIMLAHCK